MNVHSVDLPGPVKQQTLIHLEQIAAAETSLEAIRAGSRSEGMVMTLEALELIDGLDAMNLLVIFKSATKNRLNELALL
jgi:hypothetical protein